MIDDLISPAIFWFWNGQPTRDSIRRRLDAFLDRGITSVHIHPMPDDFRRSEFRGGMAVEYLSPAFFELVAIACEQIARRGMTLWLYDEGGWPSGRAGGRLVRENRAFAARGLRRVEGRIEEVDFLHECDYPDLMNIEATRRFIELTHEGYRRAIGGHFGATVRGIFTDEPRILGRVGSDTIPWSPGLDAAFEARHGYALAGVRDRLFASEREDEATRRTQRDYLSTISREIRRCYFDPIRAWCDAHGLLFEGHHTGDHDFARHGEYFGHYLEQAECYHIPGVDAIWRQVFPGRGTGNYVSLASSSAWLGGRRVAFSELFAVYGPGLTLEQMRWISAHHLVRGVNRLGVMASFDANDGPRRLGMCSDFSPQDPRWQDLDLYIRYVRKASRFTTRGRALTRVAMFYRIEQLTGEQAATFNQRHERVTNAILDRPHPLLFMGERDLPRAGATGVSHLVVHVADSLSSSETDAIGQAEAAGLQVLRVEGDAVPELPDSPVLHPVTSWRGIRALPLRREDGRVDLMLFNETDQEIDLAFHWQAQPLAEYPLDDDSTLDLRPLRWRDGVCQVKLSAGELRAWVAAESWPASAYWTVLEAHALVEGWTAQMIERLSIRDRPMLERVEAPRRPVRLGAATEELFSGTYIYRCVVDVAVNPACRYVLDLGRVFDACEVRMDGRLAGRRGWPAWRVDVTEALREGSEELSVRVTNTAAGAWLDPAVHRRDTRDWSNVYLDIATPFMRESCRAGLAGPVWLLAMVPTG